MYLAIHLGAWRLWYDEGLAKILALLRLLRQHSIVIAYQVWTKVLTRLRVREQIFSSNLLQTLEVIRSLWFFKALSHNLLFY